MVKIEIDGMICEKPDDEKEDTKIVEVDEGPAECPIDPRFQQQNKTKWCYVMFIDFHRCAHYLGPGHKHCKMFEACYKMLCPKAWIHNWEEQIDKGTFPRDLTKEMGR